MQKTMPHQICVIFLSSVCPLLASQKHSDNNILHRRITQTQLFSALLPHYYAPSITALPPPQAFSCTYTPPVSPGKYRKELPSTSTNTPRKQPWSKWSLRDTPEFSHRKNEAPELLHRWCRPRTLSSDLQEPAPLD